MEASGIQLRQEVYAADAWKIADWMEDHEVSRYLNEDQNVAKDIRQIIQRINMPILTHLFNRNGSFFIITEGVEPIGFLKLILKGKQAEMVVVIGDKDRWGRGLGRNAILSGLSHAFYEWRLDQVNAKINCSNERSIRVFRKAGFRPGKELNRWAQYSISIEEFLNIN
ncbi:MAG: GNAT family N-acetyltransferase [Pseudomonadota bacterium]